MKCRTTLGITLLMSVAGFTLDQPAAFSTPLTFGDARVTVPPGWTHVETQSGANTVLLMVPPDNTDKRNLAVVLLPGQDLHGADFPQALDTILKKALTPHEHLVQYSELPPRKEAGYDLLTRSMVIADDAGHRSVRVCFAANPRHRLEMMIVSADSTETFKHYQADVASVLSSYTFGDVSAPGDAKNPESGATNVPARSSGTNPNPRPGSPAGSPGTVAPGMRSRVPEDASVLLCTDPARLDGAMMFANLGQSRNALQALRNMAFFRVNGPALLEVRESDLTSAWPNRWPKVFVKVLDGASAGRTGWVVLSELKDIKQPAK